MRYKVLNSFKAQTSQGERELQPGQIITLPKDTAIRLLNEGRIKPYCYWLENTVDDCRMPCFEINAMTVIYECPHFKTFWAKRCKEIERKCNAIHD